MNYNAEQIKEIVTLAVAHLNKNKSLDIIIEKFEDNPEHWRSEAGPFIEATLSVDKNSYKDKRPSAVKRSGPDETRSYCALYFMNSILSRHALEIEITNATGSVILEKAIYKLIPAINWQPKQEAILCAAAYIFIILNGLSR